MEKDKEKTNTKGNRLKQIILISIGIFFIISAAMYFNTIPAASILLLLSGIILIPEINQKVKELLKDNDKIYKWIKIIFIIFSFIYFTGSVPTEVSEVSALRSEIKALNGQIENITLEKNEILQKYQKSENNLKDINQEINNTTQIDELNNTIADKDKRIQELENTLNINAERIKELENTVSTNNDKIKNLEENVNTLEKDKTSLEQKVSSLSSAKSTSNAKTTKTTETISDTKTTNSYTVYVTKTGSKYHRDGCSYLKSKISIDKSAAITQGYTACSRCNP